MGDNAVGFEIRVPNKDGGIALGCDPIPFRTWKSNLNVAVVLLRCESSWEATVLAFIQFCHIWP